MLVPLSSPHLCPHLDSKARLRFSNKKNRTLEKGLADLMKTKTATAKAAMMHLA